MAGSKCYTIVHQSQQQLTIDQEEFHTKWILDEDSRGHPPSHARMREMAFSILRSNGENASLGKNWATSFLQRDTNVHTGIGRSIEDLRTMLGNPGTIRAFFGLFEQTVRRFDIKIENIWNMNETGLAIGVYSNSRILISSLKHKHM